jgi:acyl carrier protein
MASVEGSTTADDIFRTMQEILADVTEDWDIDVGDITVETRLIDLGMESISLVYLIAELQQAYGVGDRLFRKMREEGSLLKDMTVGNVVTSMSRIMETAGEIAS